MLLGIIYEYLLNWYNITNFQNACLFWKTKGFWLPSPNLINRSRLIVYQIRDFPCTWLTYIQSPISYMIPRKDSLSTTRYDSKTTTNIIFRKSGYSKSIFSFLSLNWSLSFGPNHHSYQLDNSKIIDAYKQIVKSILKPNDESSFSICSRILELCYPMSMM